jgi:uroporphyrinogen decarboxylase
MELSPVPMAQSLVSLDASVVFKLAGSWEARHLLPKLMTSLERIQHAARGGLVDRVPVAPYMGNHGARVADAPIGEYCRSGRIMAEAQYRAWQIYGQDAVVAQSDNYYIAEGFGVQVQHYHDATPTLVHPAVDSVAAIRKLRVPDPHRDGRMPVYLEAIRLLSKMTDGKVAVRAPGTGPFSLASHIMGTEQFLVELAMADRQPGGEAEKALKRLMELSTDALIAFSRACLECGAHLVQAGDSLASPDMISPATYRKWAWPAERRFFDALNPLAAQHGAVTLLHICGNTTPVLESMADTGAHILELDHKVDLKTAKARVGHRVCLMGNLDPVELLWRGTPEAVNHAARKAIEDAGDGGGFILGSGCEVPPGAAIENLKAMMAAVDDSGLRIERELRTV